MIKKITSSILVILLLVALTFFAIFQVEQNLFSVNNITSLLQEQENGTSFSEKVTNEIFVDTNKAEITKYLNQEQFEKELANYFNQLVIYSASNKKDSKPTTDNLRQILNDAENNYEKATNKEFDKSIIDEMLNNLDSEIDNVIDDYFKDNEASKKILTIIYSPVKNISLGFAIFIIILIFVINKNIFLSLIYPGISFAINGATMLLIGIVISKSLNGQIPNLLLNNIASQFYKFGLIGLVVGCILIIFNVIYNKKFNSVA